MATNHAHEPQSGNPNQCDHCRGPWNAVQHQPSLWAAAALRGHGKTSGLPEDLQALAQYERPSGAPFVPFGALAHGKNSLSDQRVIMCPQSAVVPNTQQCPFIGAISRDAIRDHLRNDHGWGHVAIANYLGDPWYGDEARSTWKDRTFHKRYGRRGPIGRADGTPDPQTFAKMLDGLQGLKIQDSVVVEPCLHPNGYGENGCAGCGAPRPDEDDEPQNLRCPVSIDCAFAPLRATFMRKHLIEDHGWSHDRADDWLEQHGAMNVPLVPAELTEAIEAEREQNRQEMEVLQMTDMFAEEKVELDPELTKKLDAMTPAQLEALLTEWWMDLAEEEVRRVVPKAVEYGALDLIQIGQDLALTAGRTLTDEEAAELGVYFYVRGKLARWTDAIATGRRVSDDTLHDLGVYVRMAQRIRHSGGWPGLPKG